jgi:hypothetical protein
VVTLNPEAENKNKRMTRFICFELMYEFVSGKLDSRRAQEMKDYIKEDREAQRELERLARAFDYCERSHDIRLGENLHEALLRFEPGWQKYLREISMWSSQRGWRLLPYIFIALTMSVGVVIWKPWKAADRSDIILAEQLRVEPDMLPPPPSLPAATSAPVVVTQAAPVVPSASPGTVPQPATTPVPAATAPATPAPPPTALQPLAPPATVVTQAQTVEPSAEDAADRKLDAPSVGRGELTRGEIEVSDFQNSWPAIKDKIIALGGKAAGSVELGWLKRPDQSYFHMSLPESNFSELELFLATFGPVRFSKERHPRVMPDAQIRIILTVKDAATYESSSETP